MSDTELADQRTYLYRYALSHLRDAYAAEEAVQETLLAGLEGRQSFAGKSSLRTWLTAILKNKIVDTQRKLARSPIVDIGCADEGEEPNTPFDAEGKWKQPPSAWSNPEQSFESKRFWEVLECCLGCLPPATARAFYLREIVGVDTDEICKELKISASNCWVMLYRARMSLRHSLETNWFGGATKEPGSGG